AQRSMALAAPARWALRSVTAWLEAAALVVEVSLSSLIAGSLPGGAVAGGGGLEFGLGLGELLFGLFRGEGSVVVGAEVGVDDPLVGHDLVGRALGDDGALGHDDDPVADVVDHVHVVLDEQDGETLLAQVLDVAEE